jgi:hypothetical protein
VLREEIIEDSEHGLESWEVFEVGVGDKVFLEGGEEGG